LLPGRSIKFISIKKIAGRSEIKRVPERRQSKIHIYRFIRFPVLVWFSTDAQPKEKGGYMDNLFRASGSLFIEIHTG